MARKVRHTRTPRSYEQKADQSVAITPIEYGGLQEAFDFFNTALFEKTLPDCLITYQRKANSLGCFSADRFAGRTSKFGKHELALNPDGFMGQTDEQICQTLVHEMCHAWQQQCGRPSGRGYHNREWAEKMKAIGLQPSSTGMVGGPKPEVAKRRNTRVKAGSTVRGNKKALRAIVLYRQKIRAGATQGLHRISRPLRGERAARPWSMVTARPRAVDRRPCLRRAQPRLHFRRRIDQPRTLRRHPT